MTALLAAFAIITGMTVPARAAGITWTEIYNRVQSHDEKITTLYSGDLSLEKGDSYRFTWDGTWYHGVGGGTVYVSDGKNDVKLFYRDGSEDGPINGNIPMSEADSNPKPFKFVMLFDYTGKTPKAQIAVYDIDRTTLAGTIDVDLSVLSGITKIYHKILDADVTAWNRPVTGTCIMEMDASKVAAPSEAEWETVYENEVKSQTKPTEQGITFFDGNLNDGGRYRITITEFVYGQPQGHQMRLYSGDTMAVAWSKANGSQSYTLNPGSTTWQAVTANEQFSLTAVCYMDLAAKSFEYTLSSSKVDTTGTGSVTLTGSSLTKLVFHQYGIDTWSYPLSWSVKIEKAVVRPKVRSVKLVTDGKAQTIYGDGAIDPKKTPVAPTFDKILIDMNTDVDLELLAEEASLTATGSEENMLSGFTQKNYVATGAVAPDELLEDTAYTLTLGGGITTADGKYTIGAPFSLSFKTGKRSMTGEITGAKIAGGKITADVSLVNNADAPKAWSFIVSCFDASGRMLWCGAASGDEKVSDGLDTSAEVELPDGALPEGTATVKAYLWDSPIPTEIYSDGTEIVNK